eukprot:gene11959-biopygen7257
MDHMRRHAALQKSEEAAGQAKKEAADDARKCKPGCHGSYNVTRSPSRQRDEIPSSAATQLLNLEPEGYWSPRKASLNLVVEVKRNAESPLLSQLAPPHVKHYFQTGMEESGTAS